ncbi:acetate/propionate family kinase [Hoeflea sp. G2-23]|uniref:Acetate kinase n=1 Tax=Hoeflea algicola TaxID=2983763 RepID=A0ABT3Z9H4_9HYPH|nr:acetate/propionate family kinase [Hoeflea algicola]MCY0148437.1 acetate/propionate family kinase [Hoeflea algicola]
MTDMTTRDHRTLMALNCGSSSIKFALFAPDRQRLFSGSVDAIGNGQTPRLRLDGNEAKQFGDTSEGHATLLPRLISEIIQPRAGAIDGVGHRVVHGGERFSAPVLVDPEVRAAIAALIPLARSHQPHNLAGIDAAIAALPGTPQAACFDTAFHVDVPIVRREMALPRSYAREGLLRYGFHGLAYEHVAATLPRLGLADSRVIACHLGNGSSICAMINGKSAWTSMGFTPLDGLMMGQRPGRLDPGAVLWLLERHQGDAATVSDLFYHQSGLVGVSGVSNDMRLLLASTEADAGFAVEMYVDRLVQEIGAAMTSIGGCDALVFSGGIGENAAPVRARVLEKLQWLGFALAADANTSAAERLTSPDSTRHAFIVKADEELVIVNAVSALLQD